MIEVLRGLSPFWQAMLASLFTWAVTALGAAMVLFFGRISKKTTDLLLASGAGVMLAACFWSLLSPAMELSETLGKNPLPSAGLGLLFGGLLVLAADRLLDRMSLGQHRRSLLLVFSVTLHNLPEGIAVGVGFGAAAAGITGASLGSAIALAVGIGLQNFPEGAAVSLPLRRDGLSRGRAFFWGQLSGFVEPIGALLGVAAAQLWRAALPFLLSFAAGAMLAVVAGELIPEAAREHRRGCIIGVLLGFLLMMLLDVALG